MHAAASATGAAAVVKGPPLGMWLFEQFAFPSIQAALGAAAQLSAWSEVVKASALDGATRSGNLAGTFFAPTNEAVAALLDAESIQMSALTRNSSLATQLVEAHLIPGQALRAVDLQPGARYPTALPGAYLTVTKGADGLAVIPFPTSANPATVLVPDIRAGKAVMHVIRSVLVPRFLVPSLTPGIGQPFGASSVTSALLSTLASPEALPLG
ncbi:hypothetical protein WJX81_004786 [Elliptochloris bilobata]|uniref:FAS1 domain-containing protein n=1 Tax=Elliptochloris bilobata TaxID=381761 RepID=A0AAW1RBB5_9CHLO